MSADLRSRIIAIILSECGESPTLFAAAQVAWRMGYSITGPEGIGFDALDEAVRARAQITKEDF